MKFADRSLLFTWRFKGCRRAEVLHWPRQNFSKSLSEKTAGSRGLWKNCWNLGGFRAVRCTSILRKSTWPKSCATPRIILPLSSPRAVRLYPSPQRDILSGNGTSTDSVKWRRTSYQMPSSLVKGNLLSLPSENIKDRQNS